MAIVSIRPKINHYGSDGVSVERRKAFTSFAPTGDLLMEFDFDATTDETDLLYAKNFDALALLFVMNTGDENVTLNCVFGAQAGDKNITLLPDIPFMSTDVDPGEDIKVTASSGTQTLKVIALGTNT